MQPIKWLWSCADKQSHRRMICALVISAITSLTLLVNPSLTAKLVDEVIVAQNPEPLLGILVIMLVGTVLAAAVSSFIGCRMLRRQFEKAGITK